MLEITKERICPLHIFIASFVTSLIRIRKGEGEGEGPNREYLLSVKSSARLTGNFIPLYESIFKYRYNFHYFPVDLFRFVWQSV